MEQNNDTCPADNIGTNEETAIAPRKVCPSKCAAGNSRCSKSRNGGSKCGGKGKVLTLLLAIREPVAEYQQKGGLGRYEQVGFLCLLTSIYQHAYQACFAFLTMLCNLLPFIDVYLLVVRFFLDNLIGVVKSDCLSAQVLGIAALTAEMVVIFVFLSLIAVFLLFPIISLVIAFVYRLMGMN